MNKLIYVKSACNFQIATFSLVPERNPEDIGHVFAGKNPEDEGNVSVVGWNLEEDGHVFEENTDS